MYSDDIKKQILELRANGESAKAISLKLNVKVDFVYNHCSQNKVKLNSKQRGTNRLLFGAIEEVLELKKSGKTAKEIAEITGRSVASIRTLCSNNGIKLSSVQRQLKQNRTIPLSEEEFNKIKQLKLSGVKVKDIATQLGRKPKEVSHICLTNRWLATTEQRRLNTIRASGYTGLDIKDKCTALGFQLQTQLDDGPIVGIASFNLQVACKCGQRFSPRPMDFLLNKIHSCGCVKSQPQKDLTALIESWGIQVEINNNKIIAPLELDIYIPSKNIAIEYCGLHWHGEIVNKTKARLKHLNKLRACQAAGIRLITIFSDEWLLKRNQVEGFLRSILNININRVGARETALEPNTLGFDKFLDENHLLGKTRFSEAVGLRYDTELVAVLTLLKGPNGWNINRYAVKTGVAVAGGFQKLLKTAIKMFQLTNVFTYSDLRWSEGSLYQRAGMVLAKTSGPAPWNIKQGYDNVRLHRLAFNKTVLTGLLPNEKQWDAVQRMGYDRIWDCGHQKWVLP